MFSKRICMIAVIVAVTIFSTTVFAEVKSAPKVSAREPLTYKDMGIYGWWEPYFWEGPFDFLIVQAFVIHYDSLMAVQNVSNTDHAKAWNDNLMKARAAGKRVIAVVTPGALKPPSDEYDRAFAAFLANVNVDELYAVTLSEEHFVEEGRHEALVNSYRRLKEKHPDLPVYQWYMPTSRAKGVPGFSYPWLPADGWVIDEYWAEPRDFEEAVRRYRMLGVPLIHIVWAAPVHTEGGTPIPYHQSVFDGQLRVAKKYNIPCNFFCWDGLPERTWAWNENARESNKKVFGLVLDVMKKAKEVEEKDLLDWDNGCKPMETVLVKGAGGKFSYRESYDLRMKVAGEKLPEHDFMKRSLIRGLRNMKWAPAPSRIIIRPDGMRPVDASITNHWRTPNGEYVRFSASAKVMIEPQVSADVIFEVSPNGYDWVAATTIIKDGVLQLDLPWVHTELYTRLRIARKSAKAGAPLAAIDWIEVQGKSIR